jgi:hypothetical protein
VRIVFVLESLHGDRGGRGVLTRGQRGRGVRLRFYVRAIEFMDVYILHVRCKITYDEGLI